MRQMVKRMLTGLLAAAMLLTPALAAGEETKMKMNLNGHVAAQKWQTVCANAGKDFIDKRTINNKSHGNWKIKNHSINKR